MDSTFIIYDLINLSICWIVWTFPGITKQEIFDFIYSEGAKIQKVLISLVIFLQVILPLICLVFYKIIMCIPRFNKYNLHINYNENKNDQNALSTKAMYKFITGRIKAVIFFLLYFQLIRTSEQWVVWKIDTRQGLESKILGVYKLFAGIFIGDTIQYFTHRLLHMPKLYKYHKQHHEYVNTVSLAAIWFSFVDTIIVISIILIPPYLLYMDHITFLQWIIITTCHGFYEHSGFDLPIPILQLIPFMKYGSKLHSLHHQKFNCNFSLYTPIWDIIFNTLRIN